MNIHLSHPHRAKVALLALICLLTATTASSQVRFTWAPELGYALSNFPLVQKREGTDYRKSHIRMPRFNPILGVQSRLLFKKNAWLGMGLQFQSASTSYRLDDYWVTQGDTTFARFKTVIRDAKICIPLQLGVRFGNAKFMLWTAMGYRAAYLLGGKSKTYTLENPKEPVHTTPYPNTANFQFSRYIPQITMAIGADIRQLWTISVMGAVGNLGIPQWVQNFGDILLYQNREILLTLSRNLRLRP